MKKVLIWLGVLVFVPAILLTLVGATGSRTLNIAVDLLVNVIFFFAFCYGIYRLARWYFRPGRTDVERPDLLAGKTNFNQVAASLNHQDGVYAGDVDGQSIFTSIEDRAVVIGPPGTGKTAFLVSQLLQWADTKRPLVALDLKPEIYGLTKEELKRRGYRVLTYNPTAQAGERYNPLDDLEGPEALGEMAAALIPSNSAEDAVFNESARDFLDAIVSYLRTERGTVSLPSIREFVAQADGYKDLMRQILQGKDSDAREIANGLMMTSSNERLLGSIFATFSSNLRFLRYPAVRDSLTKSDFSLSELSKPVALFFQFEEQHRETTSQLMAFMIGHVMRYLIMHQDRAPTLLLLDEIGSSPKIPDLVGKLNTIRSRQLPLWTYWQSIEQMQKYGMKAGEGANMILGACDFQMVFRLNDNASADWMSKRIGVTDRIAHSTSFAYGSNMRHTDSQSAVPNDPIIHPHELMALKTNEVVCTYRGDAWRGHAMPYFKRWPEFEGKKPTSMVAAPYPNPIKAT